MAQPQSVGFTRTAVPARRNAKSTHYTHALKLWRTENLDGAREAFQVATTSAPDEVKAWVSWAQMEKRAELKRRQLELTGSSSGSGSGLNARFARCRAVLQQGLQLNPGSAQICQAWGLLELQAGNTWAALALLERSVRTDPACSPVLRWRTVQAARMALSAQRQHCPRSKLTARLLQINACAVTECC
eukprot:CAMPEP_0206148528 /NCGR_PEP_ID=MMETSP1473-20131121/36881_1 /ASSEMBLY_ACC=CAM_ASM_001109 /TAXON_ID=1461547 /ORGANISM="Stichococcus sp, Strain RCC1054" /LENGTH=187 /DNA_ID=CAMNT_0053545891 /DNA_START=160 /DNA_END=723 /DNA_ORIENTATION=-